MSGRHAHATSRVAPCPRCGVPQFDYCVNPDGTTHMQSHAERVDAAALVPALTASHVDILQKLHADPTRHIHPSIRVTLLKRGLIESLDPPTPPGYKVRVPKRRHPLTESGRAAIADWIAEQARRSVQT